MSKFIDGMLDTERGSHAGNAKSAHNGHSKKSALFGSDYADVAGDRHAHDAGIEAALQEEERNYVARNALMRIDGNKGRSLTETMAHYFYRLTWRTPLYKLRLKGRVPVRLIVSPDDPFTGNGWRGKNIMKGHFRFNGLKLPVSALAEAQLDVPENMQRYIHGFEWLRDLRASGNMAKARPIAEQMLDLWLDSHLEKVADPVWSGDVAALRVLNMAANAPLILAKSDLVYRSRVLRSLAQTARHLDLVADKSPEGLERVLAWTGVLACSLLLPDGEPRRIFGEAGLKKAIDQFICEDGGAVSRSPLAQIEVIKALSMLKSVYEALREDVSPLVGYTLYRMVPALRSLTNYDDSLGSWQGMPGLSARQMDAIFKASGVTGRPLRASRHWGYHRISAKRTVLVADAGPPPIARQAIFGCASTLAFELASGQHRLVVNCGGASALGAFVDNKLSHGLRASAAHSTLVLDNHNSTAILPKGKLGKGVCEVLIDRRDVKNATRLDMRHDGYRLRYGMDHRRILLMRNDGTELRGDDILEPSSKKVKFKKVPFHIRFHLGHGVKPHVNSSADGATLVLPDGAMWQFYAPGGKVSIDESIWIDEKGRPRQTRQIVLSGQVERGGGQYSWIFKLMR